MMNAGGPPGLPGLIPRLPAGHQVITVSAPTGPRQVITVGCGRKSQLNQNQSQNRQSTGSKLMRLRCRFRPLHDQYISNGSILEDDTDVIFLCGDGHQVRAHKVIIASSSKFFAELFESQANETSVVSIPDITVDIMKLIIQLTYRDRVYLTMKQIKEVGEFITIFGMSWNQFGYEEYNSGDEPMTATPVPPIPMKPVEIPRKILYVTAKVPAGMKKFMNASPGRSPMQQQQQNFVNGNDDEGGGAQQSQVDRRKSRLTPRPGAEREEIVEQEEEDDPENLIRDWMSKLGKRESTSQSGPETVKKMRTDDEQTQEASKVCSVCGIKFQTEIAWKWHEERHVGSHMYKCKFCDTLSKTPKNCYIHEKEVHGYSGLQQISHAAQQLNQQQKQQQQQQQQVQQQQETTNQSQLGQGEQGQGPSKSVNFVARSNQTGKFVTTGHQNFKRIKIQSYKKLQAKKKPLSYNFAHKHPQIGIGESQGSELIDVKKIKQLHWLYVCERCEHCSDSAQKAANHYNRCYPNKEKEFEQTVTKYRQGFYGKSKCPLCPRRYPQNTGFMIHCGHQHQEYRRLYVHTGNADDQLKCNNCKEAFPEPESFHQHLDSTTDGAFYCPEEPKEEPVPENVSPPKPPPARASTSKSERPARVRRADSPIESKASYKVQFHTPPKSARLASRVQAEAEAEAASKKATATDINFPPVDCPVCGDGDLLNISLHLQTKHKDLNVDVTRISAELLRCKGCLITFDICDLIDHRDCLKNSQDSTGEGDSNASSRRTSTSSAKPAKSTIVVDMDSLPPGVGRSPIERIEIEDLHSIQAIRSALKCLVCGATALRLGVIAECLRTHGIHRCSLCFNSYCSKADYALHLRKCHGAAGNKLKCPLCPKAFANAGQTSGHMYSTHWLAILKEHETTLKTDGDKNSEENKSTEEKESPEKADAEKGKEEEKKEEANDSDDPDSNGLVIDEKQAKEKVEESPKKKGESKEDDDVDID